jgi:hypothetical protein
MGRASAYDGYTTVVTNPTSRVTTKIDTWYGWRAAAKVHVVNPNVALLAAVGLVNPAAVAWALVPYSFVIDWFVDIGGLISQFDGLLGCAIESPYSSFYRRGHGTWSDVYTGPNPLFSKYSNYQWDQGFRLDRTLGLPPYHFVYPNIPRFSLQRAATAISLLIQHL